MFWILADDDDDDDKAVGRFISSSGDRRPIGVSSLGWPFSGSEFA